MDPVDLEKLAAEKPPTIQMAGVPRGRSKLEEAGVRGLGHPDTPWYLLNDPEQEGENGGYENS